MPTTRGYLTPTTFTELTNKTVSDQVEWERQATLAEMFIDRTVGPQPSFHLDQEITVTSATANTFISPDISDDRDDFYSNLRVQGKQGSGSGYDGFVTDFVSSTDTVTVSGSFDTNPDSTSILIVSQRAVFPRVCDRDPDGRPFIPEVVTQATAYALEYAIDKGGDAAFNSSSFSAQGGKTSESIGSYSVSYDLGTLDGQREIGSRAYTLLSNAGFLNETAIIRA